MYYIFLHHNRRSICSWEGGGQILRAGGPRSVCTGFWINHHHLFHADMFIHYYSLLLHNFMRDQTHESDLGHKKTFWYCLKIYQIYYKHVPMSFPLITLYLNMSVFNLLHHYKHVSYPDMACFFTECYKRNQLTTLHPVQNYSP